VGGCPDTLIGSSGCVPFGVTVLRTEGVGSTGTTGLIVALLVTFRCRREGAGGGAEGATRGGKS